MRIVKLLKSCIFVLLGLCASEKMYAQWVFNASNGTEVQVTATGADTLDFRWYGLQVHGENRWSDDDWRFVYGNNAEDDRVQGDEVKTKRPDYNDNSMYCWAFQKVSGNDASVVTLWNRTGGYMISQSNGRPMLSTSSFTILRFNTPDQDGWKAFKLLYGNDYGNPSTTNNPMTVWYNSGALEFKGEQRPYKHVAYFRAFDVTWSDREAVIYHAMKNAQGAYAGTAAADFTAIDTEYNKDMTVRSFRNIRTMFEALQTSCRAKNTTLESGFYRIKNGSSSFYRRENTTTGFYELSDAEERVMYVDPSDKQVKWAKKSLQDGVWRVIRNSDGSYTLTHYNTGYTFTTPTAPAVFEGTQRVQITGINQGWFPGYYSIIANGQHTHATSRVNDDGSLKDQGAIISYNRPEDRRQDNLYRDYQNNTEYPSASSWLFVPERRTIPESVLARARQLLAAKDVARGFTADQLKRLEELMANPLALPVEINTEIDRLLDESKTQRIPFESGFYTVINAHPDFENKANRLLYADSQSAPLWHINGGSPTAREVWYVEKTSDGRYIFTNVNSTLTMNEVGQRLRGKAYEMNAYEINPNSYPARFLIHDQRYQYLHAKDHHASADHPSGTIVGYYAGTDYTRTNGEGVDGASAWKLKPLAVASVPTSSDFEQVVERHKASENRVFGYTTDQLRALKEATQAGAKFVEIYNMRKQGRIQFDVNGFNRIYNAAAKYATDLKTVYLDYTAAAPKWHGGDMSKVDELWNIKPSASGNNNYEVSNPNTSTYISDAAGMSATSAACQFEELDSYTLPSILKFSVAGSVLNPYGNGDGYAQGTLGHWNSASSSDADNYIYVNAADGNVVRIDQTSTWYVVPATQINLTTSIPAEGGQPKKFFTTFYYPFSVELPEELGTTPADNMWGYVERDGASSEHEGYVLVKPVPGKKVKAKTAMIIETKTYQPEIALKIIPDAEATVNVQSVVWKGALAPEQVPAGTYIMINHAAWSGFYKTTTAGLISPNRVYIPAARSAAAPRFVGLWNDLDDNTTTGIDDVKATREKTSETVKFDLTGRRVKKAGKGIYVTSDGKKIFNP